MRASVLTPKWWRPRTTIRRSRKGEPVLVKIVPGRDAGATVTRWPEFTSGRSGFSRRRTRAALRDEAFLPRVAPQDFKLDVLAPAKSAIRRQHGVRHKESSMLAVEEHSECRRQGNCALDVHKVEITVSHLVSSPKLNTRNSFRLSIDLPLRLFGGPQGPMRRSGGLRAMPEGARFPRADGRPPRAIARL